MAKKSRAELTELFNKTPEMQECKSTAGALVNQVHDGNTVSVQVELPRALVQLVEFLEGKRAEDGGKARNVGKFLSDVLVNDLQDELHWLTVAPAEHFAYYRNLWNRLCEAQGAPEEKLADPLAPAGGKEGSEGPF
jgi:hypothetical protein